MLRFSSYEELLENEALKKKASKSGISYGTLKKVFNRGMAAWKSGHRPGTTPQQWGHARVNSYITKGKGTYYGADSDLSGKGKKKNESVSEASLSVKDAAGGMSASDKKRHSDMVARHGAKTKFSGSDVSYHGTDSQIQKALHIHHPDKDDKNRSLKYHKSGQHGKDHGSGATHTYNEARVTSIAFRQKNAMVNPMDKKNISDMAKDKKYKGNTSALIRDVKKKYPDQHHSKIVKDIYRKHAETNEAKVQEISKGLAMRYIGKAARDVYHKGQQQGNKDAISRLGGPTQDYKKSPERKAAMRMRGIDRATKRLAKNEDKVSDAERKAMDAFMKKGKMKKLPPGKAAGYHGKSDPGSSMKGMISPADTKQFGTKKKVGSMK